QKNQSDAEIAHDQTGQRHSLSLKPSHAPGDAGSGNVAEGDGGYRRQKTKGKDRENAQDQAANRFSVRFLDGNVLLERRQSGLRRGRSPSRRENRRRRSLRHGSYYGAATRTSFHVVRH